LVGLVGDWIELTATGEDAEYRDFISYGQEAVAELQARGAEVIIALTHMEMQHERQLAQQVDGIDLILGGHDHLTMHEVVNRTLIWKTGSAWCALGRLSLYQLAGSEALVRPHYLRVDASIPPAPAMAEVVASY